MNHKGVFLTERKKRKLLKEYPALAAMNKIEPAPQYEEKKGNKKKHPDNHC